MCATALLRRRLVRLAGGSRGHGARGRRTVGVAAAVGVRHVVVEEALEVVQGAGEVLCAAERARGVGEAARRRRGRGYR